jgi:type II secretion system protein L
MPFMNENLNILRLVDDRPVWICPGDTAGGRPLDEPENREALQRALAARRARVLFAAPGEQVRLQTLSITPEERRHLASALPFMIEEDVAGDIETLHVAHAMQDGERVTVMLCEHAAMRQWQTLLQPFQGLSRWVPEPLLLPWKPGHWCLVLEDGRAILRSGPGTGAALEVDLLLPYLDALLAQEGSPPDAISVYVDEGVTRPALPESLEGRAQWRRGGFAAALWLSDEGAALPDLLQGEYAPRLPLQRWLREWRWPGIAAAVALLLQFAATGAETLRLNAENRDLRAAIETRYREAYPQGALVDPETQLRRQLEAMSGSVQSSGLTRLLEQVGGALVAESGARLSGLNYSQRGGELRLTLTARDFGSVERLREALQSAGLDVALENSSSAGDGVRARLRIGGVS